MPEGWPAALYIETSVLRKLPLEIASAAFLQLKELCDLLGVAMLTTRLCVDEFIESHRRHTATELSRLGNSLRSISRYTDSPPTVGWPKSPEEIQAGIEQRVLDALNSQGVSMLDDVDVDQERLKEMAVKKISPFTEAGEKGFRDSIIIFTLIAMERKRPAGRYAVLVAEDQQFKDAFATLPEAEGLNVAVVNSLAEAIEHLEGFADVQVKTYHEYRERVLREFLEHHRSAIEDFIRKEVSFTSTFLTKDTLISPFDRVEGVESIDLREIESPIPGVLPEGSRESRVKIAFSAKVAITLSIRQAAYPPIPRLKLKVGEKGREEQILSAVLSAALERAKREETLAQKTVEKTLIVQATAHLKKTDGGEEYSELELERVSTGDFIAELFGF